MSATNRPSERLTVQSFPAVLALLDFVTAWVPLAIAGIVGLTIIVIAGVKKFTAQLFAAAVLAASLILSPLALGARSPVEVTAWATLVLAVIAAGTMIANAAAVRATREAAGAAWAQFRLSYPVLHIVHVEAFTPGQPAIRGKIKMVDGSQVARHVHIWGKSDSHYYCTKDPLVVIPGSTVEFRLAHTGAQSPYPAINEKPAGEIWLALSWIAPDNYPRALGWQVVARKPEGPIELAVK